MEKIELKKALEKKIPKILENSWYRLHGDFAEKYHAIKEKYKDNGINNIDYCLSYTIEDYINNEINCYEYQLSIKETIDFVKKELEEYEIEFEIDINLEKDHHYFCYECSGNRHYNRVTSDINVTSYNDKILKEYQEIFKKCFDLFCMQIKKENTQKIKKDKIHELKKLHENVVNLYFDGKLTEEGLGIFISLFKDVENDIEKDLKDKYNNFIKKINLNKQQGE